MPQAPTSTVRPTGSARTGSKGSLLPAKKKSLSDEQTSADITEFLATRAIMTPKEHISALGEELRKSAADSRRSNESCILDLKTRKRAQETICRRRKLERSQWLLEMQKKDEVREETVVDLGLGQVLSRQSVLEERLTAHLLAVRREKQIMKDNRQVREQQYQEQREKDWEDFLRRESEACTRLKVEQETAKRALEDQYETVKIMRKQMKKQAITAMCRKIATDINEIAIKCSGYRQICDGTVPSNVKRDLKTLFLSSKQISSDYLQIGCKDCPILTDLTVNRTNEKKSQGESSNASNADSLSESPDSRMPEIIYDPCMQALDDEEFKNYVDGTGNWAFKQLKEAKNAQLSEVVAKLLETHSQCEKKTTREPLPCLGLRIAIIGKPFCRKSEISDKISDTFDVSVLTSERIVELTLKGSEQDLLAERARTILSTGGELDEELLSQIVARTIRSAAANTGIILKGFPRTRTQAVILEHELTGYEEPRIMKPGALKRGDAAVTVPPNAKQRSLICREGEQAENLSPLPGTHVQEALLQKSFDIVLYFTAKNEVIFERATSIRSDPATLKSVFLDHGLPVLGSDGIHERLINQNESELGQLHLRLKSLEDEEAKLIEWYQKLGTLCIIDANSTFEDSLAACLEVIGKVDQEVGSQKSKRAVATGLPGSAEEAKSNDTYQVNSMIEVNSEKTKKNEDGEQIKSKFEDSEKVPPVAPQSQLNSPASLQPAAVQPSLNQSKNGVSPDLNGKQRPLSTVPLQERADKMRKEIKRDPSIKFLQLLADEWILMELNFTNCMKFMFRALRRERDILLRYYYDSKLHFSKFLKRPDNKQNIIHSFQLDFNSIYFDLRSDNDAKAELHHRVEDLREKLWEICDNRKEQADNEKASLIATRILEDHIVIVAEIITAMMQFEIDRFLDSKRIFITYWKEINSKIPEDEGIKAYAISKPPILMKDDVQLKLGGSTMSLKRSPAKIKTPDAKGKKNSSSFSLAARGTSQGTPVGSNQTSLGVVSQMQNGILASSSEDSCDLLIQELVSNMEAALSAISAHDEDDRKNAKDNRGKSKSEEKPQEAESLISEAQSVTAIEIANLHSRLQRIVDYGSEFIREIRASSLDLFQYIEELIGASYRQELSAVKDLIFYVKLQIEQEAKLPLEMKISGEKFELDSSTLTFVPEPPEPPPEPLEKELASFTVSQLMNLSNSLLQLSKNGLITVKAMHGLLRRLLFSPNASDFFPSWIVYQRQAVEQIICELTQPHDPYETGFLSWKKFILAAASILPCPSHQIESLRCILLENCTNGQISIAKFSTISLWFDDYTCAAGNTNAEFRRGTHIRNLIEKIFVQRTQASSDRVEKSNSEYMFDFKSFALICCCHPESSIGLRNIFTLLGNSAGEVNHSELLSITSFCDPLRAVYSKDYIEEVMIRCPRGNISLPQKITATMFLSALTEVERSPSTQKAKCLLYSAKSLGSSGFLPSSRRSSEASTGKINFMYLVPRVAQQLRRKDREA